jgi:hypothetical protein
MVKTARFLLLASLLSSWAARSQPEVDVPSSLRSTLKLARELIHSKKPDVSDARLVQDEKSIVASLPTVKELYGLRGLGSEKAELAIADRWVSLRTGEFAIPSDFTLGQHQFIWYGLAIEVVSGQISDSEFAREIGVLVRKKPSDAGDSKWEETAFNGLLSGTVDFMQREHGLNKAEAYSVVAEAWYRRHPAGGGGPFGVGIIADQMVRVLIYSVPTEAEIWIDGQEWPDPTNTDMFLMTGTHEIKFAKPGYEQKVENFYVKANRLNRFESTLTPIRKQP